MKTGIKVVFLSNYFNHHQKPFSDAMHEQLGDGYLFVETGKMSQERKKLGWGMDSHPGYVVSRGILLRFREEYQRIIDEADVVIIGSAPNALVRKRIGSGKLTFRYSERPLKKGFQLWKYPYRWIKWRIWNPRGKPVYMLCASAYTAGDYAKFGMFRNRCFKWGYFPETIHYEELSELVRRKKPNSLVWVARYIDWKHPEIAVELASRLRADGYDFELNMIGNGVLLERITEMVKERQLEDVVHILGAMKPEEVRRHMEQAQIHIFTSDRKEGWGAVLNEAMNSACVPVADRNIGSAPFLIRDGVNGYTYRNTEELYQRVRYLLDNPEQRETMAQAAYETIIGQWNAETAAERFLELAEGILAGKEILWKDGPCSRTDSI